jgi:hypothetical protein
MNPILLYCIPILFVIFTGFLAGPLLVLAFNPRAMQVSYDSPEATAQQLATSAPLREWAERLGGLGFTVIGLATEKLPLWGPAFRELAMVSTSAEAYAGIVLHPSGEPASLYFYTPIRGGGMVFTRNFAGDQVQRERYSVRNVQTINFAAILSDHVERVQEFRMRGLQAALGSSQAARLAATAAYYDSEYGRASLRAIWKGPVLNFVAALVILLVVIILMALGI